MKSIPLKIVEVELDGARTKLSYRAQITEIVRTPADGKSANIDEVRRSIRILDALEAQPAADELQLEDADFEYLKQRVNAARWPVINKFVLDFVGDVTGEK